MALNAVGFGLIGKARQQDTRQHFDELIQEHGAQAAAYARTIVGDPHAAEDLVQETFLALYQNAERYDWSLRDPRPLIFKVLTRRALNFRRNRKARREQAVEETRLSDKVGKKEGSEGESPAVSVTSSASTPLQQAENSELANLLKGAMAGLPEKQRMVLYLRVQADLSYQEIGEIMGESTDHVGILIFRAKASLRSKLES